MEKDEQRSEEAADPSRDDVGRRGESLAAEHLRAEDWTIRDRNVEWNIGELDIVASRPERLGDREVEVIAFVEVKTRRSSGAGIPPEANVTRRKRSKLATLGKLYLDRHDLHDASARFDIVAVRLDTDPPEVSHYPAAFDVRGRFN